MLEGLENIDWRRSRHAYGAATDVPELLRGLASGSEDVRMSAIDALYGNIWHQGDVYPATAMAVPFRDDPLPPDKLSPLQQEVLQAVLDAKPAWDRWGDFCSYLWNAGVPDQRRKLKAFLKAGSTA